LVGRKLSQTVEALLGMRESFHDINQALASVEVEQNGWSSVSEFIRMVKLTAGPTGARIFFVGNGGSAAIASHMAADWMKNGKMPTLCFNDAAQLTCISNDLGYENVFSLPLQYHGRLGDVLFAISSSGESKSIIHAVNHAKNACMNIVTLSGFEPDNRLRGKGGVNFYVPSKSYGTVEIAHLAILHSLLDEVTK
jgi:D-sedoheptulose 7-phosphate isomerase